MKQKFTLPYPPSVNTYWRHIWLKGWKFPRVLISRAGREYKTRVRAALLAQHARVMVGPVALIIQAYPPDKRTRDIDNPLKALLDACSGVLYDDDSQIDILTIARAPVVRSGKLDIEIWEMTT